MKFVQSDFQAVCQWLKLSKKNQSILQNIITDPATVDYYTVSAANTQILRDNKKVHDTFSAYCNKTEQRDLTTPKRTAAQIKADEDFIKTEFEKINVPMVDYNIFLGGLKK